MTCGPLRPSTGSTSGSGAIFLIAVRCAHRPCLESGRGMMLCELSPEHVGVTVVPLTRRELGYCQVKKCEHCGGWNGIRYAMRQQAA